MYNFDSYFIGFELVFIKTHTCNSFLLIACRKMTHPTTTHVKKSYPWSVTWWKSFFVILGKSCNGWIIDVGYKTWSFIEN